MRISLIVIRFTRKYNRIIKLSGPRMNWWTIRDRIIVCFTAKRRKCAQTKYWMCAPDLSVNLKCLNTIENITYIFDFDCRSTPHPIQNTVSAKNNNDNRQQHRRLREEERRLNKRIATDRLTFGYLPYTMEPNGRGKLPMTINSIRTEG